MITAIASVVITLRFDNLFEVSVLFVMMGKDKKLSDHGKGQIEAFSKTGISNSIIVIKI